MVREKTASRSKRALPAHLAEDADYFGHRAYWTPHRWPEGAAWPLRWTVGFWRGKGFSALERFQIVKGFVETLWDRRTWSERAMYRDSGSRRSLSRGARAR